MCGIVGIQYGPGGPEAEPWTPAELMQLMLPAIQHRGPHSFGWMSWDGGKAPVLIRKSQGRVASQAGLERLEQVSPKAKWVVGHVRYATHGCPSVMVNNHPILHGNIVGVHNGVLRNHGEILRETGREDPRAEVDSEAIFAAVNRWGTKALARIRGDMVAVMTDLRSPQTLTIARSYGRPLVYARTAAGSIIFASEEQAITCTDIPLRGATKELKDTYTLLKLRRGRIKERAQYFRPPPKPKRTREVEDRKRPVNGGIRWVPPREIPRSEVSGEDLERWLFSDLPGYRYDDDDGWVPID